MSSRLPPLNALRAFEVAARHLSFKNAALELSVTPTAMFGSDYIAVCSPKLLHAAPPLRVPDDMRFQVLLHDESTTSERSGLGWDEWLRLAGVQGVNSQAGPRFSDSGMVYVAALDGLGWAWRWRQNRWWPLRLPKAGCGRAPGGSGLSQMVAA